MGVRLCCITVHSHSLTHTHTHTHTQPHTHLRPQSVQLLADRGRLPPTTTTTTTTTPSPPMCSRTQPSTSTCTASFAHVHTATHAHAHTHTHTHAPWCPSPCAAWPARGSPPHCRHHPRRLKQQQQPRPLNPAAAAGHAVQPQLPPVHGAARRNTQNTAALLFVGGCGIHVSSHCRGLLGTPYHRGSGPFMELQGGGDGGKQGFPDKPR